MAKNTTMNKKITSIAKRRFLSFFIFFCTLHCIHTPPVSSSTAPIGFCSTAPGISLDKNGDGTTEVGVYSDGLWYLDVNGDGAWDGGDADV
ncbi:MAG: hypothetical protein CR972_01655, partial [Candidatus Moraniibacteriota bacterium]